MATSGVDLIGFIAAVLIFVLGLPVALSLLRYLLKCKYAKHYDAAEDLISNNPKELSLFRESLAKLDKCEENVNGELTSSAAPGQQQTEIENDAVHCTDKDLAILYLKKGIKEKWAYWGLSDKLFAGGVIFESPHIRIQLPPGLAEDFLFYCSNQLMPISFLLSDENHPDSALARAIGYCTAQSFALGAFVFYYYKTSGEQFWATQLMSLLAVVCEQWILSMILCPCLDKNKTARENESSPKIWFYNCFKYLLRCIGGLFVIPVFILLLCIIIGIAATLNRGDVSGAALGFFFLEVIIVTFIVDLALSMCKFMTQLPQVSIAICSKSILDINTWTTRRDFVTMSENLQRSLSIDEQKQIISERRRYIDVFCCCCYCCGCGGYCCFGKKKNDSALERLQCREGGASSSSSSLALSSVTSDNNK